MLGRVISFGGTAYIINTIALECTNVLGAMVLGRVVNLGGTTNVTGTIMLGRVIDPGGGTIIHVTLQCKN
jgi:hypothetical protein